MCNGIYGKLKGLTHVTTTSDLRSTWSQAKCTMQLWIPGTANDRSGARFYIISCEGESESSTKIKNLFFCEHSYFNIFIQFSEAGYIDGPIT